MTDTGLNLSAARGPPPDYDLSICIHRHEIIATAVETEHDSDRPVPVRLYHWRPPTVCTITTVFLSPNALSAIDDFTPLGTFFLQDDLDIPETLFKLLAAAAEVAPPPPSPPNHTDSASPELPPPPPEEALPALIAQLDVPNPETTKSSFVRFFSFPVYSNSPDQLLKEDGLVPVWKWAKPDSPYYRKWGFWEGDLAAALEDGEWNGGRELRVLVRGVEEEVRRVIARGERKVTRLEEVMEGG